MMEASSEPDSGSPTTEQSRLLQARASSKTSSTIMGTVRQYCSSYRQVMPTATLDEAQEEQSSANYGSSSPTMQKQHRMSFLSSHCALEALKGSRTVWTDPAFDLRHPSGTIRVFLSSTFTDTVMERNKIIQVVAPKLQEYGDGKGIRVQLVEMRWGIQDMATNSHLTWDICREELQRCIDISMGIFFVSLVSEKYGWRPIPRSISEGNWNIIQSKSMSALFSSSPSLSSDSQPIPSSSSLGEEYQQRFQDLHQLYAKDENCIPPVWTLKPLVSPEDKARYYGLSEPCRRYLALCVPDWDINQSVTHWETNMALQTRERDRILWIRRVFNDFSEWSCNPKCRDFVDFTPVNAPDLEAREWLRHVLHKDLAAGAGHIIELQASLVRMVVKRKARPENSGRALVEEDEVEAFTPSESYLNQLCDCLLKRLKEEVNSAAVILHDWKLSAAAMGFNEPDVMMKECLHHIAWAKQKQQSFFGRQALLEQIVSSVQRQLAQSYELEEGFSSTEHCHLLFSYRTLVQGCSLCRALEKYGGESGGGADEECEEYGCRVCALSFSACPTCQAKLTVRKGTPPVKVMKLSSAFHHPAHEHPLTSELAKGQARRCDICDKGTADTACWYQCRQCGFDLCDKCMDAKPYVKEKVSESGYVFPSRFLVLVGGSGSGKSALLSMVGKALSEALDNESTWIIFRFCGTSALSKTRHDVIRSIVQQLAAILGETAPLPTTYGSLVTVFYTLLTKIPQDRTLIVVMDSLDQLADSGEAGINELQFLPVNCCPSNVFFLLSCLSDHEKGGVGYEQGLRQLGIPTVTVCPLDETDGCAILTGMLQYAQRQVLNEGLLTAMMSSARDGSSTPLLLHLIVVISKKFASYDLIPTTSFTKGVKEAVAFILDDLELNMGKRLVSHTLSYVTFSRFGVSEDELLDLLTLDDEVLKETFQYWVPPIHRMPQLPLFRLLQSLGDLIVVMKGNCIQWHHRQILECAKERYIDLEIRTRKRLSDYFTNAVGVTLRESRLVKPQMLFKDGDHRQPNLRRCHEGGYQLTKLLLKAIGKPMQQVLHEPQLPEATITKDGCRGGEKQEEVCALEASTKLVQELCTLEAVEARAKMKDDELFLAVSSLIAVQNFLRSSVDCQSSTPHGENAVLELTKSATDFLYWIRQSGHLLKRNSSMLFASAITQPCSLSLVHDMATAAFRDRSSGNFGRIWCRILPVVRSFDKCMFKLEGHTADATGVAITADGQLAVSASSDTTIRVWRLHSGICEKTMTGHSAPITSVTVTEDCRKVVSASYDRTIGVWDLNTGFCQGRLRGHTSTVTSVVASSVNQSCLVLLSGSRDKTLRVWHLPAGTDDYSDERSIVLEGHAGGVLTVALTPDGRRAISGSEDMTIRLWYIADGGRVCQGVLAAHCDAVSTVIATADGRKIVSGSADKTLRIWDIGTGVCERTVDCSSSGDEIRSVAVTADGLRAIVGFDWKTASIWNLQTSSCEQLLEGHSASITCVAIAPNGWHGVSASEDTTVRVWNLRYSESVAHTGARDDDEVKEEERAGQEEEGHTLWVSCVALTTDDRKVISGSYDTTIRVWDIETGECERTLEGHLRTVSTIVITPDGTRLLSGSIDKTIRLWDLSSGECIDETRLPKAPATENSSSNSTASSEARIQSLALTADGRTLVVGSGCGGVFLCRLSPTSGKIEEQKTMGTHSDAVTSVYVLPNGGKAVSGSHDNTIRVWSLQSEQCEEQTLVAHDDVVSDVLLIKAGN